MVWVNKNHAFNIIETTLTLNTLIVKYCHIRFVISPTNLVQ